MLFGARAAGPGAARPRPPAAPYLFGPHARRALGLLYPKFSLDCDGSEWRQARSDPPSFEALADGAALEAEDASHRQHRVAFRAGARVTVLRVTGRYRITWDDADVA